MSKPQVIHPSILKHLEEINNAKARGENVVIYRGRQSGRTLLHRLLNETEDVEYEEQKQLPDSTGVPTEDQPDVQG